MACRILIPLLVTSLAVNQAAAVDYDKIERRLTKEPAYETGKPGYALLLFGPEARLAVWTVLDGKTLYIDRNGDGDLTAKEERFAKLDDCKNVELRDPDGKTRYVIAAVQTHPSWYTAKERREREAKGIRANLDVEVRIHGVEEYWQHCDIQEMWDKPAKTQIAHFHGPLTIETVKYNFEVPPGLNLKVVNGEAEVVAVVGTMSQKHGCWVVLGLSSDTEKRPIPDRIYPNVDIEFPPRNPGDPPIVRRYELKEFC